MDAPIAGADIGSMPSTPAATPSNFEAVIAARAAAAEMQPIAGESSPAARIGKGSAGMNWNEAKNRPNLNEDPNQPPAKLSDFQDADSELAVVPGAEEGQQQAEGEGDEQAAEGAALDPETLAAMTKAIQSGKLPFDLLKNLTVDVPVNGEMREVTLEEARGGYMRRAAYTRELEKAYGMQQQAQQLLQLERGRNQEWQDPRMLRAGMRALGLEQSFAKAAFAWAEERVNYMKLPPSERALTDRLQQIEAERERERQMLQAQQAELRRQQAQQPDQLTQQVEAQLKQIIPRTFKQHGIGMYPLAHQAFLQQLQMYCPDGQITQERVDEAALATKEFLSDLDRMRQQQGMPPASSVQPQQPPAAGGGPSQAYPLAPRRLPAGRPPQLAMGNVLQQPGANAGKPGGRRPSDFVRRMGLG